MKDRGKLISYITLLCFLAGAGLGFLRPELSGFFSSLGGVYVSLLKYLALPAVVLSVFHAALQSGRGATGTLIRALVVFVALFAVSFLLSAVPYALFKPGKRFAPFGGAAWAGQSAQISLGSILENIFSPQVKRSVNNLFFPAILLSLAAGLIAGRFRSQGLMKGTAALEKLFSTLLSWLKYVTPLGVFTLMAAATGQFGLDALLTSGAYVGWAYGGCLLVLFFVMMLPLWLLWGVTPWQYLSRMGRLFLTSLSTCSSAATLTETMRTCREAFGVPEGIVRIAAPLGSTVHMCGGAVSFCLLGLFCLQMTGRPLTVGTFLLMLLLAEGLNMAAPGIPGGGIVLGATFLSLLGLEGCELFLGMYAGIYRLLDMAYTSLNVAGDVTANKLIEGWEKTA